MKKTAVIALTALILAGCNTVAGFGRDITSAADSISGSSSQPQQQYNQPQYGQ
ncbi:entericidin [Neisseria sp.]|uniref:entericidin n=1 Tax=Neisseria sp. TaxID=192066 RepID=UPI0035A011E0